MSRLSSAFDQTIPAASFLCFYCNAAEGGGGGSLGCFAFGCFGCLGRGVGFFGVVVLWMVLLAGGGV